MLSFFSGADRADKKENNLAKLVSGKQCTHLIALEMSLNDELSESQQSDAIKAFLAGNEASGVTWSIPRIYLLDGGTLCQPAEKLLKNHSREAAAFTRSFFFSRNPQTATVMLALKLVEGFNLQEQLKQGLDPSGLQLHAVGAFLVRHGQTNLDQQTLLLPSCATEPTCR